MKFKKNDQVLIIAGKDKGKKGKITKVLPKEQKIVIEGVNIRKKHQRPRTAKTKGQVIQFSAPLSASKVMLVCHKCSKQTRIGYSVNGEEKYRICKKCKNAIE